MMDLVRVGKQKVIQVQKTRNDQYWETEMVAGAEEKKVIGYYTEDGNIYCVDCISKNVRIMKEIDRAITAEDPEGTLVFCEGCDREIK